MSKGFEYLKLAAKPKVLENLKRSWKTSWKVMEFKELKRVRTLPSLNCNAILVTSLRWTAASQSKMDLQ